LRARLALFVRLVVDPELAQDLLGVAVARVLAVLERPLASVGLVLCVGSVERVVLRDDLGVRFLLAAHARRLPASGPTETPGRS
jgi:hypothetical protein